MRLSLPELARRRLDPDERYGLRVTLLALAVLAVAVPFGLLLDQVVRHGPLLRLDTSAALHLHAWVGRSPGTVRLLKAVTALGSSVWLVAVASAAVAHELVHRHVRLAVFVTVTTLTGFALNAAVKHAVGRPRPSLLQPVATASGQSFPSGHAMSSTVVYGAVLLVLLPRIPRRRRPAVVAGAAVLVGLIGFTRLALGVHYVSDVLGGWVLGAAWLAASTAAFTVWRVERGEAAS